MSTIVTAAEDTETGSWTPVLAFDAPGTSAFSSYAHRIGRYTRIGRRVWVDWSLNATLSKGTGSGPLGVTGLPFTVYNDPTGDRDEYYSPYGAGYISPWTQAGVNNLAVYGYAGRAIAYYFYLGSGGVSGYLSASNLANGSLSVYGSLSYEIA